MSDDEFDTGDSPPKIKDLLDKTVRMLVHNHHCKTLKPLKDAVGRFGVVMRDQYGNRFYLIAKGSKLYKGVVSSQAYVPNTARDENTPIILAWKAPDADLRFYMFDPEDILASNIMNVRRGVQFRNWPIRLGKRFYPTMDVGIAYGKLHSKKHFGCDLWIKRGHSCEDCPQADSCQELS